MLKDLTCIAVIFALLAFTVACGAFAILCADADAALRSGAFLAGVLGK